MQKEDLKIGNCVSISNRKDIIEAVVFWFNDNSITLRCLFENYKISDIVYSDSDIGDLSFASVPHFCKIENLYDIFQKYCQKENTNDIQILGMLLNNRSCIFYFKIGTIFLETVSFVEDENHFPLHVYIKECKDVQDFDIPSTNDTEYYVIKNSEYFYVTNNENISSSSFCFDMLGLNYKYDNPSGVSFFNDNECCLTLFELKNDEVFSGFMHEEKMFMEIYDNHQFRLNMEKSIIK